MDTGPKLANMTQLAMAIVSAQVAKKKKKNLGQPQNFRARMDLENTPRST